MGRVDAISSEKDKTISLQLNQSLSLCGTPNREMFRSKTPLNPMLYEENNSNDDRLLVRNRQQNEDQLLRDASLMTINKDDEEYIKL